MLNTGWGPQTRRSYETSPPRLLHLYFEAQVAMRPNKLAVEFSGELLTYAELDAYANQIAHGLISRGVRPGDLVALYLKKSPRLYAAMLGILKAGAGYVPIDPRFPLERIKAILDDSRATAFVTEHSLFAAVDGVIPTPIINLDRDHTPISRLPATTPALQREILPSDLCYVIYTSGSTGRPKGVMIEHQNAAAFVRTLKTIYKVTADDRVYQGFSTAFDASIEEIWAALSLGGTLIVPTEEILRSPADVADFVDTHEITYFSTVPTLLAMIDRDLPTVRTLVLGGEACSAELVARWAKPGRRMLNTYGPTEATVVATWSECAPDEAVSIGVALPGYTAHVLDEALNPVAVGETGELYIGGAGVARGYMNLPELTAQRFIADPFAGDGSGRLYRTFDHVRLGENGELYFLGRLDDQIKIRGFRIELSEIESVLVEHPSIKAAAVAVVDTKDLKELAAYVVTEDGSDSLDRNALAALMRDRMPAYMVPQYLDVVAELPMMSSGKIDRKALPPPQKLLIDGGAAVPPANDLERAIAGAWQQTFGLPEISVEADFFFDLGGHSLLAAQVVARMRDATGKMFLSVRDIYEHRTVRCLAAHLAKSQEGRENADLGDGIDADEAAFAADGLTASDRAFASVHPLVRWTTVTLQAVIAMTYYAVLALPLAYVVLVVTAVIDGDMHWTVAAGLSTVVGFAAWPFLLLLSIAVKWIVVGRYKAGRYPLWSGYYLRWWTANRFQALAWAEMFKGTPLMSLYWRAMGAKIGRDVTISTNLSSAWDMVSIGDNASIGAETQILGYRVEDGYLVIAPVSIGNDCFVGMQCSLGLDSRMGDGSRLDDMSLLPDGIEMAEGEARRGIPALPATVNVPERKRPLKNAAPLRRLGHKLVRTFYGFVHLALIYAMGYFLLMTAVPSVALVLGALYLGGPWWGVAAAFASIPLGLFVYIRGAIMLKRLIGPLKPGTMSIYSFRYLRHWFAAYLLENTKTLLMPVYATIYLPPLLRALGAKIGKGVEISTVSQICPDVLEIGEGSFLADACLVGGERIHNDMLELGAVKIGSRTFIGNSAVVTGGHTIGDDVLIGVASTPPADTPVVPNGTRWLGSPSFALPNTQKDCCFTDAQIFKPSLLARLERALTDAVRILLPSVIAVGGITAFVAFIVAGYRTMPLWQVFALMPVVTIALAYVAILLTAMVKEILTGPHGPVVKPLWSRYVWHNELVNGVYETIAAAAMQPLMGTPLIAPCLRMMGCKVGKWCFIDTTLFSEFDLVDIGDRACLNLGATIQTHLFEDRIFKADHLRIGHGCTVGNMAVVLYGTEMQAGSVLGPLSVLMKGETLPPATHWHGIPCERIVRPHKVWPRLATASEPCRMPAGVPAGAGLEAEAA
jgi:non-ribosomal peptide synthetase-like protein